MKRIILPFLLLFAMCACDSTAVQEPEPVIVSNMLISFDYMQSEFAAAAVLDENGVLRADITKPENIKGLSIVCGADGVKTVCGSLESDAGEGYIPFADFYDAVSFIKKNEPVSTQKNGKNIIFGYENGAKKYKVCFDTEKNKTVNIETPLCVYDLR